MANRIIGIRHRVKRTAEGESRPTLVAIKDSGRVTILELEDEQAELDFAFGKFPTATRPALPGEDLSVFPEHHRTERKKTGSEEKEIRVPESYEGLMSGDSVVMILGGSGDPLAYALSRHGREIGAKVLRIPGFQLALRRNEATKEVDHVTLVSIFETEPGLFYEFGPADRNNILVSELHRARREAQQARIGCEQRLRQALIGKIFLSEEGGYPEGTIADAFTGLMKKDAIYLALKKEEGDRTTELRKAVHKLPIWQHFLLSIEGCGEVLAAGIISPIIDIRMFDTSNSPEIDAFRAEILDLEARANRNADRDRITVTVEDNHFTRTGKIRAWKAENGKIEEALLLDQALMKMRQVAKLKKKGVAKLKAFCGVHVLPDGRFARKRTGATANWNPRARQALFLLGDQFNKRADSEWGLRLREYKVKLRAKHPVVECSTCGVAMENCSKEKGKKHTKRYTDGHIHKMAIWRTITKFVERLHREWKRIDGAEKQEEVAA